MEEKGVLERVEKILREKPQARNNDQYLMCAFINDLGISVKTPFYEIENKISHGLIPSHESISRARRKVQEMYDELRSNKQIERARKEEEKKYREFYGHGN